MKHILILFTTLALFSFVSSQRDGLIIISDWDIEVWNRECANEECEFVQEEFEWNNEEESLGYRPGWEGSAEDWACLSDLSCHRELELCTIHCAPGFCCCAGKRQTRRGFWQTYDFCNASWSW